MAINIKEILHPNDSDSIKFEKVNYNFDQLLVNGGGPQGIQGVKGEQGADGATGVKGQKGELGVTGAKGDIGIATTLWAPVPIVDSIILKPKSADVAKSPTVWLGDSDFEETVNNGKTNGESRLTLETGKSPDNVSHFLRYYTDSTHIINVNNRVEGSTLWYTTKPDFAASANSIGIEYLSDKFKVAADSTIDVITTTGDITLGSGGNIEITGSTGFVNIARPVIVTGYLNVNGTSHIKIPAGTTIERPTGAQGMIRYNQTLSSFEGHNGSIWQGLGGLIDTDQDTYIVAEKNADEDILRFNVGTTLFGSPGTGIEIARMGGTIYDGFANTESAIEFLRDQDNLGDVIVANDKGLLTKARSAVLGANEAQPVNSGSDREFRRLDDYFYQETTQCDSSATEITTLAEPFINNWATYPYGTGERNTFDPDPNASVSYDLLWLHKQETITYTTGDVGPPSIVIENPETPVALAIDKLGSKITYIKTGHLVQCWGNINFYGLGLDIELINQGINMTGEIHDADEVSPVYTKSQYSGGRIAFYFAELGTFPYTNASTDWIYFPIPQRLNTTQNIRKHNQATNDEEIWDYWGAIPPGANYFNIAMVHPEWGQSWWKTEREKGDPYSTSTTDNVGKMLIQYMTLSDLRAFDDIFGVSAIHGDEQLAAITSISFNFSMPTNINSYDTISTVRDLYTETRTIINALITSPVSPVSPISPISPTPESPISPSPISPAPTSNYRFNDCTTGYSFNATKSGYVLNVGDTVKYTNASTGAPNQCGTITNTNFLSAYTDATITGTGCSCGVTSPSPISPEFVIACFTYDSQVEMYDGTTKSIGLIKVGEEVKSFKNGQYVKGIVTETLVHPTEAIANVVVISDTLIAEPKHPVLINNEWTSFDKISDVEQRYITDWYNLEIDGDNIKGSDHNYIIDGYIVSGLGDNEVLNKLYNR